VTRPQEAAELIPSPFLDLVGRFSAEQGAVGGPSGSAWAANLPRLLASVLDDWGLEPRGPGRTGWTAVVVPVQRAGEPLVLKLVWPHLEARDEPLVLRHWDGHGAVRLIAADPSRGALLLEALDASRDLGSVDIDRACEVAGGLLRRLCVPAPPGLRTLSGHATAEVAALARSEGVLPRRMLERATALARELTSDEGCDASIIHTDLHYENILAGKREPWLAIDPKPLAGHPGFEVQPLLRNRVDELGSGSAFRHRVRRRLEIVTAAAGIDEDQALAWTYLHTAIQAGWAAKDGDSDAVSFAIALLKALDG
jgi:streptomycin 6-kinase